MTKKIIQLINDYWKFDNDQDSTSTLHDKNDLIKEIEALSVCEVVGRSEQCGGCDESTGETKLWCCNHCGKRTEPF